MILPAAIENRMIDDLTPRQVRHLHPVLPARAEGRVAELYRQIRRDFQLVPPLTMLSQEPDLLAGMWAIVRESQIVCDRVSRREKEALSAAVSIANDCPYCVDAHLGMLSAADGGREAAALFAGSADSIADPRLAALVQWGLAVNTPDSPVIRNPPFSPEEAPEVIGTALAFQFVNRMVGVFLGRSPLPFSVDAHWFRRIGVRMFGMMAGGIAGKRPRPGDSLALLPGASAQALPDAFGWARPNPQVSAAYAGMAAVIAAAGECLPGAVRDCLTRFLADWNGEPMGLGRGWLDEATADLGEGQRGAARLVLLCALAPQRIDDRTVAAFRAGLPSDGELLRATAWSSWAAVERIGMRLWR